MQVKMSWVLSRMSLSKKRGLPSVLFIAVFPVSITMPGRWLCLLNQTMNEQIRKECMEEIGNIRRNVWVKSWTSYLIILENVADVGSLVWRGGWRGRGREEIRDPETWSHMSIRVVWWTTGVIAWLDCGILIKLKPLPLTSLGKTGGKMFPMKT